MYLSSFEDLRRHLFAHSTIDALVELETNAFEPAMVTVCGFVFSPRNVTWYRGGYTRLSTFKGAKNQATRTLEAIRNRRCGWFFEAVQDEFTKIPGCPVAYWASEPIREAFASYESLGLYFETRLGMSTANNDAFVRDWFEVDYDAIHFSADNREHALAHRSRWFPYQKGGSFRKWYGNNYLVVDWENDGVRIRNFGCETGKIRSHNYNLEYIFQLRQVRQLARRDEGGDWRQRGHRLTQMNIDNYLFICENLCASVRICAHLWLLTKETGDRLSRHGKSTNRGTSLKGLSQ